MAEVIVVGGGVGGMVTALLLARDGHDVRIYERLPRLGGKLAEHRRDGFTFSIGPSLLTLPGLFLDLGVPLDLLELDELCRYRFADGSTLSTYRDPERTAEAVDRLAPGEGRGWRAFHRWAERCLDASTRTFFAGPPSGPVVEPPFRPRGQRPGGPAGGEPGRSADGPVGGSASRPAGGEPGGLETGAVRDGERGRPGVEIRVSGQHVAALGL
ncbi:NAD(P)-binding protein, partial [Microbispora rosea]